MKNKTALCYISTSITHLIIYKKKCEAASYL